MSQIDTATPGVTNLGIRDKSFRALPQTPLNLPQHLPVHHILASKGKVGSNFLNLASQTPEAVYGSETFRNGSIFHNASTEFLRRSISKGNNCIVRRLIPSDINDVSNVVLYLDVLPVDVPLYEKEDDGSLKLDAGGNPVPVKDGAGDKTVPGFSVFWVVDFEENKYGDYAPGVAGVRQGVQTAGGEESKQYPIFEFAAQDVGSAGNLLAVRIWASLRSDLETFPNHYIEDAGVFPMNFGLLEMIDPTKGTTNDKLTPFGALSAQMAVKEGAINPLTDGLIDFDTIVDSSFITTDSPVGTGLGHAHVYYKNLKELTAKFRVAEIAAQDDHTDVELLQEDGEGVFNFVSFVNSNGSPYQAVKLVDGDGSIRLTKNTHIYLKGGTDGTITDDLFDALVRQDVENYSNPLHPYQDIVLHPESIIYDVGYSLDTKKALCKFIALRKDTFVVFSTFIEGKRLPIEEQYSLGVSIKAMLDLYPESSYFATAAVRAMIIAGSGRIVGSGYLDRVPLSFEVLSKSAGFMGASDGRWVEGKLFDRAPESVITGMKDIDIDFIPAITAKNFWVSGINFPANYKVDQKFFPALKTVYDNDTSVLTSYFNASAAAYLSKIGHHAWREYSGTISLTNTEFERDVNTFISNLTTNRFNNIITVVPECKITEHDAIRGFSWTLVVKMYANNSRTVQTLNIDAYRASDLG